MILNQLSSFPLQELIPDTPVLDSFSSILEILLICLGPSFKPRYLLRFWGSCEQPYYLTHHMFVSFYRYPSEAVWVLARATFAPHRPMMKVRDHHCHARAETYDHDVSHPFSRSLE